MSNYNKQNIILSFDNIISLLFFIIFLIHFKMKEFFCLEIKKSSFYSLLTLLYQIQHIIIANIFPLKLYVICGSLGILQLMNVYFKS